jgi:adenine-specific DNA-methyltransferase
MKYMGSKLSMLSNGLGTQLLTEAENHSRFVDLMTGSGAVAWFIAESTNLPVLAVDLQEYAAVLAKAIIGRTRALDHERLVNEWVGPARTGFERGVSKPGWGRGAPLATKARISAAQRECSTASGGAIWTAYGGHYFSPDQARALDQLLAHLPTAEPSRSTCIAALIVGASRFVAAPGHTAQPLRPTKSALPYLQRLWRVDPFERVTDAISDLAQRSARTRGQVRVADARSVATRLRPDDLVFLDPPYSAVHYSRFYHVYETLARGTCGAVEGAGRYPPMDERPSSDFSIKTRSRTALDSLIGAIAQRGSTLIITFPESECSNGLTGKDVTDIATEHFLQVEARRIPGRFSTLGGNGKNRAARHSTTELMVVARQSGSSR